MDRSSPAMAWTTNRRRRRGSLQCVRESYQAERCTHVSCAQNRRVTFADANVAACLKGADVLAVARECLTEESSGFGILVRIGGENTQLIERLALYGLQGD